MACYLLLSFLLIAPLIASILANYLVDLGRIPTLAILCTGPSVILSFTTSFLQQSALFVYRESKLHAFNIINKISKINLTPPIIIDLSRSYWRKLNFYRPSLPDLMTHKETCEKLLLGFFLNFVFYFNSRTAQIQLDNFTDTYLRGTLMNSTTAVATITLIILITKFRLNNYRYLTVFAPILSLATLIYTIVSEGQNQVVEIGVSIALRYVSDLSYSIFLIWAIQTYPTVCRTRCLGIALCGACLGSALAYSLYSQQIARFALSFGVGGLSFWLSSRISLDYEHKLCDTLSNNFYDQEDKFKSV